MLSELSNNHECAADCHCVFNKRNHKVGCISFRHQPAPHFVSRECACNGAYGP
jgi:hypothetical protein